MFTRFSSIAGDISGEWHRLFVCSVSFACIDELKLVTGIFCNRAFVTLNCRTEGAQAMSSDGVKQTQQFKELFAYVVDSGNDVLAMGFHDVHGRSQAP